MSALPPHALEPALLATLRRALHPIAAPPQGEALNLAEIADLLDDLREPAKAAVLVAIVAHESTRAVRPCCSRGATTRCATTAGRSVFPAGAWSRRTHRSSPRRCASRTRRSGWSPRR
jgi:hypothetical protein